MKIINNFKPMKKKTQILSIHGGMAFKNKSDYLDFLKNKKVSIEERVAWSGDYLKNALEDDFQLIKPRMPLADDAKYEEWKIHFEKLLGLLDDDIILLGNSLGGIFLAKYLSENIIPKKIISTYLVCPPFEDSLIGENLAGGFELQSDLSMIEKNCKNVKLLFSEDDDCVPVEHAEKYKEKLVISDIIIYEGKNGHFDVPEFPELVEMIKNDLKK